MSASPLPVLQLGCCAGQDEGWAGTAELEKLTCSTECAGVLRSARRGPQVYFVGTLTRLRINIHPVSPLFGALLVLPYFYLRPFSFSTFLTGGALAW